MASASLYGQATPSLQDRIAEVKRLTAEAINLRREGKLDEAIALWKKRHALVRDILGNKPVEGIAGSLAILAEMQEAKEDFPAAAASWQEVEKIRGRLHGNGHWQVIDARFAAARARELARMDGVARHRLAAAVQLQHQAYQLALKKEYRQAVEVQQQGVAAVKKELGTDRLELADALNTLGFYEQLQGSYKPARGHYEQSLALRRKLLGEDHPRTAQSYRALASLLQLDGLRDEALPYTQQALASFTRSLGEEHPDSLLALDSLASLLPSLGEEGAARHYREQHVRLTQKVHGKESVQAAQALTALCRNIASTGDFRTALARGEEAVALLRKLRGKDAPETAHALIAVAVCYRGLEDDEQARKYFHEAHAIFTRIEGEEGRNLRFTLGFLAADAVLEKNFALARKYLEKQLAIVRRDEGPASSAAGYCLHDLGLLQHRLGDYPAARESFEQALTILRKKPVGSSEDTCFSLQQKLGALYGSWGRWDEAVQAMDASRHGLRGYLYHALWSLPDAEQLAVLHFVDELAFQQAISLGVARRADPAAATWSADWVINGKGVAHDVLARRALLMRDAGPLMKELLGVRQRLAALVLREPKLGTEVDHRQEMARLGGREQDLIRQLGQTGPARGLGGEWVELEKVRKAVPKNAVLVEIVKTRVWDFAAKAEDIHWRLPRYVAWVIPPAGEKPPRVIDLGEADRIEEAVRLVLQQLQAAPRIIGREGEGEAEGQLRAPLAALSRLLLEPLRQEIDTKKRWLISPDGELWLAPWAALLLPEGGYAIEKHHISFLVSGRSLVEPVSGVEPAAPLVLADPDYDLKPAEAAAQTREVLVQRSAAAGDRARSGGLQGVRWRRLPGTAKEARAITASLKAYARSAPQVYLDKQALEAVFKAARNPRVVVLSTHGFFLQDELTELPSAWLGGRGLEWLSSPGPRPVVKRPRATGNPLLRCGLVLAGANNRSKAGEGEEDGVLTGLEIVGTDLRGCELVVLSACETGVGEVRNGEGVAGLRQAFQLAGARAVAATLWKIPDTETADLVARLFANLQGRGKADALREAQLAVIEARRAQTKAAHPFYWAAFTLTGEWK
jgi:CHAT domain-containing protein/tetratricopeptide (TPR) repeat protein